jgi:hypothetical protein
LHDHSWLNLGRAGSNGAFLADDLNQAQTARTSGNQTRVVAKVGNIDAVIEGQLQNRLAGPAEEFYPVYCNCYLGHIFNPSLLLKIASQTPTRLGQRLGFIQPEHNLGEAAPALFERDRFSLGPRQRLGRGFFRGLQNR